MIEYKLEKNELTTDPNDYRAVVVHSRVYSEEELINRILESNAGLSLASILAVKAAYKQTLLGIIREGALVNDNLFTISFSIPGKFSLLEESEHHTIEVHLHPSHDLREAAAGLKARQVAASGNEPSITAVMDINSGTVDSVSSGGVFVVKGHRLKVTGSHTDVGLYFKATNSGQETKFSGHFAENLPSRLMLQAPPLATGTYHLSIKTQYSSSNGELKEPRTLEYANILTVI